jgi:hypothetical protein
MHEAWVANTGHSKTWAGNEWSVSRIERAFAAAYQNWEVREQLEAEVAAPADVAGG